MALDSPRPFRRRAAALIAASALLLTAAGCGSGSDDEDGGDAGSGGSDPYKLLVVVATSGPAGPAGELSVSAIKVAADEINAAGGVDGREIEVEVADDGADPAKSVSVLQKHLQGSDKPDAVYAGLTSDSTLAMLPILTAQKVFNIGTTASKEIGIAADYPYTFRPTVENFTYTDWVAATLKEKGYGSVGVLSSTTGIGTTTAAAYAKSFADAGLTAYAETYNATDQDFTSHLERLHAKKPDVVVFEAGVPTIPPLILQAREKLGLDTPYYADYTLSVDLASLASPEQLEGVGLLTYANSIRGDSDRQAVLDDFIADLKENGAINSYLVNPALAHDAVMLLKIAADVAGSTDPEDMKAALEGDIPAEELEPMLTYSATEFSTENHFNQLRDVGDDYAAIDSVGPMVDGQYTDGSAG